MECRLVVVKSSERGWIIVFLRKALQVCSVILHSVIMGMRLARKYSTPTVDLYSAEGRELTFEGRWQFDGHLSARKMAEAVFFMCPKEAPVEDCVYCAYCNICLGKWVVSDFPLVEHAKWSPQCRFMKVFPRGTSVLCESSTLLRMCELSKSCPCFR